MISINTLLVEYEQNIQNAVNNYGKKVKELDILLNSKRKEVQKKITVTRDRYKKAKNKLSTLEKKALKSRSKILDQSITNAQKSLFQTGVVLENLMLEMEDIKTYQKTIKSSKAKSIRVKKHLNSILMR
ncbi:MAG: hypothetical protein HND53_06685 [Proteobacteria bacterium]|nr:hypothetical protein [Pseudomonadota bacterium]NOG60170.1 hypothetical protein [Pseudomonadota bacterium]